MQIRKLERSQPREDEFSELHERSLYKSPNLSRLPLEPDENLLEFIATYGPSLADWERDLLLIVDKEAAYFIPQIETKIMNEGWASYWHFRILNELNLPQALHMEFLVRHNQVLRPTPGGLNPYHLGFILWKDIERRWNEGDTGVEYAKSTHKPDVASMHENDTPGRKKMFEVRESDRDVSFLRRFLTKDIMQELHLFEHEKRGKERVVSNISDEDNWEQVKETLIRSVGMGSRPIIKVVDADFGKDRTLLLRHEHEGRDLQLDYCEKTLMHLQDLWRRNVVLETIVNGKKSRLKLIDNALKVERA
jgi:stage V sporulation protein R